MLILAGVPGSGKSTLAESLIAGKPWMYVRVNQDTLGSRRECEDLARKVLQDGKCPIIDRCNFDPTQRKHFLNIALSFKVPVDCVVFQYDMSLCIRRCQARRNHETITPQIAVEVVQRMVRQFSPPLPGRINAETFRNLKTISNLEAFNDVVIEYLNLI
jgi:predicted kinase